MTNGNKLHARYQFAYCTNITKQSNLKLHEVKWLKYRYKYKIVTNGKKDVRKVPNYMIWYNVKVLTDWIYLILLKYQSISCKTILDNVYYNSLVLQSLSYTKLSEKVASAVQSFAGHIFWWDWHKGLGISSHSVATKSLGRKFLTCCIKHLVISVSRLLIFIIEMDLWVSGIPSQSQSYLENSPVTFCFGVVLQLHLLVQLISDYLKTEVIHMIIPPEVPVYG